MENMKTIAVIESCDTKFKEAKFISDFIKNEGLNALVINTATGPAPSYNGDIVNIGLHFILKNVRPYAAPCSEA